MRRAWWLVIPAILGAAATALALGLGDRRTLLSETSVAWVWLAGGVLASLVLLGVAVARARERRALEAGRRLGVEEQRGNQSRLLARLDHELKNPITAILAGVSNLDADEPAVASIQSQATRLSRLLTDLRKLGELRSVEIERAPVDLEGLLAEVVDAVGELPDAADRSITVAFPRAPRPLPAVSGDTDLLFLAFYNLLANAVKFSAPGDAIDVRGLEVDGTVVVSIADTGRGVPAEEQALVWEELARGRESLSTPGSGLGLPFVRTIVDRHGGDVQLSSRAGEGTLLRVSLPIG